jgi:Icc-related predicted phosphoesterase
MYQLLRFNEWLRTLNFRSILVIPGNHDTIYEDDSVRAMKAITNGRVLIDEMVEIDGLKIWGSPWTPTFYNWGFNANKYKMQEIVNKIPKCDVLITHGPPYLIQDWSGPQHVGCPALRNAILGRIKPKLHVFGHIHAGAGAHTEDGIQFINAAMVNERYEIVNNPWVITLERN